MAWVRLAGLVVGVTAALVLVRIGPTGVAAPAIATAVLVAVLVSEMRRPRPRRQPGGVAALEVRRIRDYVRPRAAWGVLLLGLVLVAELAVLLAVGRWQQEVGEVEAMAAAPTVAWGPYAPEWAPSIAPRQDPMGVVVCDPDQEVSPHIVPEFPSDVCDAEASPEQAAGPGAVHERAVGAAAGTIGTALAAVLVGAFALRATVRAPRPGADGEIRQQDERWRRGRAETTLAAVGWILAVPLALWNVALVLTEDSAALTGPAGYARLAGFAALAAAATVAAALSAAALSRFPDR